MLGRTTLRAAVAMTAIIGVSTFAALFARTAVAADDDKPVVVIETSKGQIVVERDRAKAPISVANFLKYVDKGFYDGVVFHRVMPDFMVASRMLLSSSRMNRDSNCLAVSLIASGVFFPACSFRLLSERASMASAFEVPGS